MIYQQIDVEGLEEQVVQSAQKLLSDFDIESVFIESSSWEDGFQPWMKDLQLAGDYVVYSFKESYYSGLKSWDLPIQLNSLRGGISTIGADLKASELFFTKRPIPKTYGDHF